MKTNLRNPVFTLIASMLLALSIGLFSCEKTMDDITFNDNPATDEPDPGYDLPPFVDGQAQNDSETGGPNDVAFDYKLKTSYCSRYGTSVAVIIEYAQAYSVRWEVDGVDSGTGMQLYCVTGNEATAYVTRAAGNVTVIKSRSLRARELSSSTIKFKTFDYIVKMSKCGDGAYSLSTTVPSQSLFDFSWLIDGEYALDQPDVDCICAESATLIIKRKSDGASVSKTITLPACKPFGANIPAAAKTKPNTFDFQLKAQPCENGKVNVAVNIHHPQKYRYAWKVNNKFAGHEKQIECVCGKLATVEVTRLSDGFTFTKSITLPTCSSNGE